MWNSREEQLEAFAETFRKVPSGPPRRISDRSPIEIPGTSADICDSERIPSRTPKKCRCNSRKFLDELLGEFLEKLELLLEFEV